MKDSGETDRVLVIDDDPGIRRLLISARGFLGFEVDAAGDLTEALAQVARRAPDVVILDVMLPGADGFEILPLPESSYLSTDRRTVNRPSSPSGAGPQVGCPRSVESLPPPEKRTAMVTRLYRLGAFGARRRRSMASGRLTALAAIVGPRIPLGGSARQPTDPVGNRA